MATRRGKVVNITPPATPVPVNGANFRSHFTPNWDKEPGQGQAIARQQEHHRVKNKAIPRGPGVAKTVRS